MRDAIDAPENAVAVVASVFRFNKQTNQWAEVGTGTLKLAFKIDQVTKKDLRISLDGQQRSADGAFVRHYIEPDTALEPNVGSDRAWVFRANDAVQLTGEVLALQFASASAAKRFEAHFQKLSAMYHIISEAEKERASPPSGTQPPPPAPSTHMSHATQAACHDTAQCAPLRHKIMVKEMWREWDGAAAIPELTIRGRRRASSSAASRGIRGQRRRLSVVSDNPNIEGIRRQHCEHCCSRYRRLWKGHRRNHSTRVSWRFKKGLRPLQREKGQSGYLFHEGGSGHECLLFWCF